jgi:hypothetical protein
VALRKHRDEHDAAGDERELLREQRDALEGLRRQLAERVQAVGAREQELREAIAQARAGKTPAATPRGGRDPGEQRDRLAEVERRERAVAERERAAAGLDETTAETRGAGAAAEALAERERALAAREQELERRAAELDDLERRGAASVLPAADPSAEQLERIERRMSELREAESLFMRTRQELAARSDAVAQREHLVAQRERELDEREDGAWERADVAQLETRLRRLEQHERSTPDVEQTQGFSGGFRKLSEEGAHRPPNG